jgi:hypothetical protein
MYLRVILNQHFYQYCSTIGNWGLTGKSLYWWKKQTIDLLHVILRFGEDAKDEVTLFIRLERGLSKEHSNPSITINIKWMMWWWIWWLSTSLCCKIYVKQTERDSYRDNRIGSNRKFETATNFSQINKGWGSSHRGTVLEELCWKWFWQARRILQLFKSTEGTRDSKQGSHRDREFEFEACSHQSNYKLIYL